jgi:hypothetical protein
MEFTKDIFYDNDDFNLENDLHNGQIYLIKNKINDKCYIGQALCFTGKNNSRWGTEGRWKSHIREALKSNQDHCVLLNNAIRKYGEESFDIFTLVKCPIDELNLYEVEFIKLYNSIQPNGYNIKEGGSNSKNSSETIEKMKTAHLGVRREKYNRKYDEDNNLPKYIKAQRNSGIITGYVITKFPIGTEKTEYIKDKYFYANSQRTIEKSLEEAIVKLEELKEEYKHINEEIFKDKSIVKPKITLDEKREKIFKDKINNNNIFPIVENTKLKGYYVDEIYDNNGNIYPKKTFVDKTNRWNLNSAKKYVEQLEYYRDNNIDILNIEELDITGKSNKSMDEKYYLPTYVNRYNHHGVFLGFMINGYPLSRLDNGKYKKTFAENNLSLDENYNNCIEHLNELKVKYPIEEEKKKIKEKYKKNNVVVI